MKKIFYAFVMMAAAMVGCQNVDENVNINNGMDADGLAARVAAEQRRTANSFGG